MDNFAPLRSDDGFEAAAKGSGIPVVKLPPNRVTADAISRGASAARFVHLNTHGRATADREEATLNSLERSYLALSDANNTKSAHLSALTLSRWNLTGVYLLTLSACDSGGGDRVRSQGNLGVASAAVAAGARNVIASSWLVDDAVNQAMFSRFYSNLFRGQSPREALLEAQQKIRTVYPAPYAWAGWVLLGLE